MAVDLELYKERLERGEDVYRAKYDEMYNAEKAYRQIMPDDIMETSTNQDIDENASKFLFPAITIVAEKIKKELAVNNPQFRIKGANEVGQAIQAEFEDKISSFFSSDNWGFKSAYAYHYLVTKGTMVTRTIYKVNSESILVDNKLQTINRKPSIDIMSYDPATVIPDYDADPKNWSATAKWCIITLGYYSRDTIVAMFPHLADQITNVSPGVGINIDFNKYNEEELSGVDKWSSGRIVVREYYTNDGYVHTIVSDSIVADSRINDLGVVNRMPINICPLKPDPNSVFGFTNWHFLKNTIACASRVLNQVLDNNELNNEFPLVAMKGHNMEIKELADSGRKIIEVNLPAGKSSLKDVVEQLTFREITAGAQFLFNVTSMLIQQISGVTNESLGVRERQMRVAGEAEIIGRAILTNSSDVVLSLENSYINPTIWDMFRIFYRNFNAFKFKSITKEFLANFDDVRVANGSTLAEDKVNKQQFAGMLLQLASAYGNTIKIPEVLDYFMKSNGEPVPQRFINSPDQIMQNQQALNLQQRRILNEQG